MKLLQKIVFVLFFATAMLTSFQGYADNTNPPDPPGEHGQTDDQSGGSAPIGGGLFILLGLGAAYGGKKLYDSRKEEGPEK